MPPSQLKMMRLATARADGRLHEEQAHQIDDAGEERQRDGHFAGKRVFLAPRHPGGKLCGGDAAGHDIVKEGRVEIVQAFFACQGESQIDGCAADDSE